MCIADVVLVLSHHVCLCKRLWPQEAYYTGDEDEDAHVLQMVQELLTILKFVVNPLHLFIHSFIYLSVYYTNYTNVMQRNIRVRHKTKC